MFAVTTLLLSQDLFTHFSEGQISKNQQTILKRLKSDSSTIDLQIVKVNTNYFKNCNSINLNLSSTKNSMAIKQKLEKRSDSDFSWFATIPEKNSDIIISVYKDAVVGYIVIDNECYNLRSLGEGLNALVHTDPSKYPPCGNCPNPGNYSQNSSTCDNLSEHSLTQNNLNPTIKTEKLLTTNTIIRVLVAYTENAKIQTGGENSMNALIANSITSANDAFYFSNLSIKLELAHRRQVIHNESNNDNYVPNNWCEELPGGDRLVTLQQFQAKSDGKMDEIHALRDAYAADICVLITTDAISVCGQAYEINANSDEAFCVVQQSCASAAGKRSFTHEIGHIFGGRHQSKKHGADGYDPCDVPYSYAHGYAFTGNDQNDYRTMMNVDPGRGLRIKYFSNPSVPFQGVYTGDVDHNVAGVLNIRQGSVSNFRVNHNINDHVTLTEDLEIQSGFTLTVQAGKIVKLDPGIEINISGTMSAQGTPSQKITFTSSASNPQSGDWNRINFYNSGIDTLKYCDIEYGHGIYCASGSNVRINNVSVTNCHPFGLWMENAFAIVDSCNFSHDGTSGIYLYNSSPNISYTTCTNNNFGLFCYNDYSDPNIGYSTFSNNNGDGIFSMYYAVPWLFYF